MKLSCPSCGAGGSAEMFIADAEAREAILEAAKLPSDCGSLVIRYIGMFRPEKRGLTMDRAARLIREICEMITTGVEFDRQQIQAPSHVWRQALAEMLDSPKVKRPLKNHNYLLRIVQSKLSQRADIAQGQRADQHRGESHAHPELEHVGKVTRGRGGPAGSGAAPASAAGDAPTPAELLDSLSNEDRERWCEKARTELIDVELFSPKFVSKGLIEQKAGEMLKDYLEVRND